MNHRLDDPWFEAHFIAECAANGSYRSEREDGSSIAFAESQGMELWCPCGIDMTEPRRQSALPLGPFAQ